MTEAIGSSAVGLDDEVATASNKGAVSGGSSSSSSVGSEEEEDFYIQCDAPNCNKWHEGSTLSPPMTPLLASTYETWHCPSCIPYHGPSKIKSVTSTRQGLRKKRRIEYIKLNDPAALLQSESNNIGVAANDVQEIDFRAKLDLRRKKGMFRQGGGCCFKVSSGKNNQFTTSHVNQHGFNQPVLFTSQLPYQIGLKVPGKVHNGSSSSSSPFSFDTVAKLVGPYRKTQVIDTATQLTTEYTLQEWVDYLHTPEEERTRVLNVITLEYSQTPLGKMVTEPLFAREVDFVNLCWPKTVEDLKCILDHNTTTNLSKTSVEDGGGDYDEEDLKDLLEELQEEIPRVSKYCLMSAAGSYTDFHVDFGGTAVWYHVYFGQKIFYFIEPTPKNLKIYSEWATNGGGGGGGSKKTNAFLPDLITAAGGEVYEVHLKKGQTMFIPSGWIHAVYTPKDSLVFGGNFVHMHSLEMQLTIFRLEKKMRVGKDYKFPYYQKLMWFVAWDFLKQRDDLMVQLRDKKDGKNNIVLGREQQLIQQICAKYPNHVLLGYKALAKELESWSRSKQKNTIDQFPENMDVAKVATQLGELLTKCVAHVGINPTKEKPKLKSSSVKKKEKTIKTKLEKKRQHSQISQKKKKPVITPIKKSSSSSPPANKICKVEGCTQYKRSKCDGYCATHYREQLSLQGGGDGIDYNGIPPPGRGCKVDGCNKYKKSKCEGYCLMCFRASCAKPATPRRPSSKRAG